MNNRAAFWIAVVIVLALVFDWLVLGNAGLIFSGRQLWRIIEWLAFWR